MNISYVMSFVYDFSRYECEDTEPCRLTKKHVPNGNVCVEYVCVRFVCVCLYVCMCVHHRASDDHVLDHENTFIEFAQSPYMFMSYVRLCTIKYQIPIGNSAHCVYIHVHMTWYYLQYVLHTIHDAVSVAQWQRASRAGKYFARCLRKRGKTREPKPASG